MSKGENELFDGIQILSPQELEESHLGGEIKSEDSENLEVSEERVCRSSKKRNYSLSSSY